MLQQKHCQFLINLKFTHYNNFQINAAQANMFAKKNFTKTFIIVI